MSGLVPTTRKGKRLEARAALANTRSSLKALHAQLDFNAPESDELARIATEIRRSLETLDRECPDCGHLTLTTHPDGSQSCGRCMVEHYAGKS